MAENINQLENPIIAFGKDISIELNEHKILDGLTFSIRQKSKIGVIGANGTGKTTLLKFIGGQINSLNGDIKLESSIFYVPQVDLRKNTEDSSVMSYLANISDEWWDVLDFAERQLGLTPVDSAQSVLSLSGGEFTKLNIALGGILKPKILLLDEPSNHLDLVSLSYLINFINSYQNAIVLVSHDEFLLSKTVNQVWELADGKAKVYQNSYDGYLEQKEIEKNSLERNYIQAQKELKKARQANQEAIEKAAKSRRTGKALKHDRSMSTIEKGYFANKASKSAGDSSEKTQGMIDGAKKQILDLRGQFKHKRKMSLQIASVKTGRRHLIQIEDGQIRKVDKSILLREINFDLYYGDRITFTGKNGCGKTTLAKIIAGLPTENHFIGEIYRAPGMIIKYFSQNYELVDPNKTILENITSANPDLGLDTVRQILGDFLFFDDRILNKSASLLSGGEVARLSLAILNTTPIDLLILDEPTNNLDIVSLREFEDALTDFTGAILIISHNIPFLSKLNIDKSYVFARNKLVQLSEKPDDQNAFFEEIIQKTINE